WRRYASRADADASGTGTRQSGRGARPFDAPGWDAPLAGAQRRSFARAFALQRQRAIVEHAARQPGFTGETGHRIAQAVRFEQLTKPRVDIGFRQRLGLRRPDDNYGFAARRPSGPVMLGQFGQPAAADFLMPLGQFARDR